MIESPTGGSIMKLKKLLILIAFMALAFIAFGFQNSSEHKVLFEKAKFTMETKGDLKGAIKLFEEIILKYSDERDYAAKSQLYVGFCYEKLGMQQAQEAFQRVIDDYPDQTEAVKLAKEKIQYLSRAKTVAESGNKEFKLRKVWEGPGADTTGAVSPNGKYLSFVDWETGDLAIREIATGQKRRLTDKGPWLKSSEFGFFSEWSRDSRQIVCNWYNKDQFFDLRIFGLDGSPPRVLFQDKGFIYVHPFDWSPDGKYILAGFWKEREIYELRLVSVQDGAVTVLKTLNKLDAWTSLFSTDGRYIAYEAQPQQETLESDIFLLSIEGGREIPLVQHPADDLLLGWSRDGRKILFLSDRTGSFGAWTIEVEDGKPSGDPFLIKGDIGRIDPMGFTEDGSFYYGVPNLMFDIYKAKIDPATGKILDSPTKATRRFEGSNITPDWSPDGKSLAYMSRRRPNQIVLCIRSEETGKERELRPTIKEFLNYARWSPDGRSILVKNFKGFSQINAETGDVTTLMENKNGEIIGGRAIFSPDGRSIYYVLNNETKNPRKILVRDLNTGAEKELYSVPLDDISIALSRDGRRLAIINSAKDLVLRVMPTSGGESKAIYKFGRTESSTTFSLAWSADGRYIFFSKPNPENVEKWELFRIPADGAEPQNLGISMMGIRHLTVHPDGQQIAFTSQGFKKSTAEVWVMENFLPEHNPPKKLL
jgi:Tol biopolymer transport system component